MGEKPENEGRLLKSLGSLEALTEDVAKDAGHPDTGSSLPRPDPRELQRWSRLRELARVQSEQPTADALRTLHVMRPVDVSDYAFFTLDDGLSVHHDATPVVGGGRDGLHFWSATNNHVAHVQVEVWSAPPPLDTSETWELVEVAAFSSDWEEHVFVGAIAMNGEPFQWAARGTYGVRVYCVGRLAVRALDDLDIDFGDDDDDDDDAYEEYLRRRIGVERWLLQIWQLQAAQI